MDSYKDTVAEALAEVEKARQLDTIKEKMRQCRLTAPPEKNADGEQFSLGDLATYVTIDAEFALEVEAALAAERVAAKPTDVSGPGAG